MQSKHNTGVTIAFKVGNAAFRLDDGTLDEVAVGAKIVEVGTKIANGARYGSIIDINGNKVGEFSVEE